MNENVVSDGRGMVLRWWSIGVRATNVEITPPMVENAQSRSPYHNLTASPALRSFPKSSSRRGMFILTRLPFGLHVCVCVCVFDNLLWSMR